MSAMAIVFLILAGVAVLDCVTLVQLYRRHGKLSFAGLWRRLCVLLLLGGTGLVAAAVVTPGVLESRELAVRAVRSIGKLLPFGRDASSDRDAGTGGAGGDERSVSGSSGTDAVHLRERYAIEYDMP